MNWTFNGATFSFVEEGNATPVWLPEVQKTRHFLLGTNRYVDCSNGSIFQLSGTITITPQAGAAAYTALRNAYLERTIATLDDGDGSTWDAIIEAFQVRPLVNGVAGYEGPITFGRPRG